MRISIIVPTRNRAEYLEKMLESLLQQTVPLDEFEVIVIDNGSTDSTRIVCKRKSKQFPNFKYIFDRRPGLHVGRNRGFLEAKSDYLLFADDDIIAFPTWVEGVIEGLDCENVGLVGGNVIPKFEKDKPNWYQNFLLYRDELYILTQLSLIWTNAKKKRVVNPYYIFGCNFGVKREVLEKCKGFHPDGMPHNFLMYRGDGESYVSEYVRSHGIKAMFVPKASVYHTVSVERTSVSYLKERGKREGISNMYTVLRQDDVRKAIERIKQNGLLFVKSAGDKKEYYKAVVKGNLYLLLYYIMYPQIREWIKKKDYF